MGVYAVTVGQYAQFLGETGYKPIFLREKRPDPYRQTPDHPVVCVTWDDSDAFCKWLSKKEGRKYRLPTEAEWEYACRAGTKTPYFFGEDSGLLGRYIWYKDNSGGAAHPVGQLSPNPRGLYDMCGNVWQWTADWYAPDYYQNSPMDDPPGPGPTPIPDRNDPKRLHPPAKVLRGGCYIYMAASCRSAARKPRGAVDTYAGPFAGFRVVCDPGR